MYLTKDNFDKSFGSGHVKNTLSSKGYYSLGSHTLIKLTQSHNIGEVHEYFRPEGECDPLNTPSFLHKEYVILCCYDSNY